MPEHRAVYLGASGRIGRLLRAAEPFAMGAPGLLWQFRSSTSGDDTGFLWPDFRDPTPLIAAQAQHEIDRILIFSGASGAKDDVGAMRAHVTSVDHALTAAVQAGIPRVLVASSSAVYGPGRGQSFREEDALAPINAYGHAKAEMEELCARRAATEGIEICALRIGNVAGADMLLTNAMKPSEEPLTLDIFPDGRGPQRSYIGPMTLLSVLQNLMATEEVLPSVLNLAGARAVDMADLLDAAEVPWQARPCREAGHQVITLDISRLEALCPELELAGGAQDIVGEWQRLRGQI